MAVAAGIYTQNKDPKTGLTKRQTEVLTMLTDEHLSQLEVSERLGVSRQRVRQIVETLMDKGFEIPGARHR